MSSARCVTPCLPSSGCLPWIWEWCQVGLHLLAQVLERRRQRQTLAEVLLRLVGRKARADGGDLEQDSARLPEIDRAEVEAVDHGRRVAATLDDPVSP